MGFISSLRQEIVSIQEDTLTFTVVFIPLVPARSRERAGLPVRRKPGGLTTLVTATPQCGTLWRWSTHVGRSFARTNQLQTMMRPGIEVCGRTAELYTSVDPTCPLYYAIEQGREDTDAEIRSNLPLRGSRNGMLSRLGGTTPSAGATTGGSQKIPPSR